MRRFLTTVAVAASLAVPAGAALAQSDGGFFKSPVFVLMPSVISLNRISAPAGAQATDAFNVRFQTVLPTSSPWFTGVAGVQWMPNLRLGGDKVNLPIVFYGGIIPVIQPKWTDGWFSVSVDPLGVFFVNPRGGGANAAPYSNEFTLEGALVANLGAKMMKNMGPFSNLGAFFLVDQRITHPDIVGVNPTTYDRWDPVLVYGLLLPLAPWK